MKTIRSAAFLMLVAGLLLTNQGRVAAAYVPDPEYYYCTGGCTCTVDHENWAVVTIECEEVAPIDECPYAWNGQYWYCNVDLPNQITALFWTYENRCVYADCSGYEEEDFEGCTPLGEEPPTSIEFNCGACLLSEC